jgi:hypothetical protein
VTPDYGLATTGALLTTVTTRAPARDLGDVRTSHASTV